MRGLGAHRAERREQEFYLRALLGLPQVDPERYRAVVDRLLER
ncbi:hypothetical protein [Nocardia sp. NPDC058497]